MTSVLALNNLESTGTDFGSTFYADGGMCRRKVQLKREQKAERAEEADLERKEDRDVGRVFHRVMQSYHKGESLPILPATGTADASTTEALRLYSAYRSVIEPKFFGRVVDTEIEVPGNTEQAERILKFFGAPVTGRLDMLVEMSQADVDRLSALGIQYLVPGIWIVDHKTKKKSPTDNGSTNLYGIQAPLYIVALRCLGIDCKGFIANMIVRHKELTPVDLMDKNGKLKQKRSFQQYARPYFEKRDEAMVVSHIRNVYNAWADEEERHVPHACNPSVCHSFGTCTYLNVSCQQY